MFRHVLGEWKTLYYRTLNNALTYRRNGEKKEDMKTYKVRYYLDNFYHTYLIDAENEYDAIDLAIRSIPSTNQPLLHDFKIERYFQEWNY